MRDPAIADPDSLQVVSGARASRLGRGRIETGTRNLRNRVSPSDLHDSRSTHGGRDGRVSTRPRPARPGAIRVRPGSGHWCATAEKPGRDRLRPLAGLHPGRCHEAMHRMNRRGMLFLLAGGTAGAAVATGGAAALRLHSTPRTYPFLSDDHLAALASSTGDGLRVLFIGNSMTLGHDVPGLVAEAAARDGITLNVATAAANGARLVETIRLPALEALLRPNTWDAIVLQDYTRTPLRFFDRWGSAYAIGRVVARTAPTPIVLFPPWPAAEDNAVYDDAGLFAVAPDNPADFADRTMDFYDHIAAHHGSCVAQVPRAWLEAVQSGQEPYSPNGHHSNSAGAALVAGVLWDCLRRALPTLERD